MFNIIIDGDHFFYRTLHSTNFIDSKQKLYTKLECEQFVRKVATDIAYSVKLLGGAKKLIITKDSRSWRKDIDILENEGYKSTREKTSEICWDNFYKCMTDFYQIVKEKGIEVTQIDTAESDDLIMLWSNKFLENKENCIILSADKDLTQLVKLKNDNFVICFNPINKSRVFTTPIGFKTFLDNKVSKNNVASIFDDESFTDSQYEKLIKLGFEFNEISGDEVRLEKIICGDGGDAIPSIYTWQVNGRNNKISGKRYEKIRKELPSDNYNDIINHHIKISQEISGFAKCQILPEHIKNQILRNIKLVVLSEDVIPQTIVTEFNHYYNANPLKNISFDISVSTLLKNTPYYKDTQKVSKSISNGYFSLLNLDDDKPSPSGLF